VLYFEVHFLYEAYISQLELLNCVQPWFQNNLTYPHR